METNSALVDYLSNKIMDDVRCGRQLDGDLAISVYKYPFIDRIRTLVTKSDRDIILELASAREDDVAVWSFAVGGLLRSLEEDPEVRKLFEDAWKAYRSFDRRYHLLFRLLDYTDLDPVLRDEIWEFVKSNFHEFVFEQSDWYGGANEALESVRRRLADASFPDQKKWIYLLGVLASSDRDGARALLQRYSEGSDAFTRMVAQYALEQADSLWGGSAASR